jgi:hypothetical protein
MTATKLVSRLLNILSYPQYHVMTPWKSYCNACERRTVFLCDVPQDRYIRRCVFCRSTPKYRAIASAIEQYTSKPLRQHMDEGAAVYELTTTSPLCRRFLGHGEYT